MPDKELLKLAHEAGFFAALTTPDQIPVDPKFRIYCEENRCGRYNANYSCPPDCGTVEALHQKLLEKEKVLILQTIWDIDGYEDKATIQKAKETHNSKVIQFKNKLIELGYDGFCTGYNGCSLCNPCKKTLGEICAFPELKISCMSAYCVDVAKLAEHCNLAFAWSQEKLHLFGMIAFTI